MELINHSTDIEQFEHLALAMPQVDCPVTHKFVNGHYIREVFLPKGALCVGHHQNFQHINMFIAGKVNMLNNDGTITTLTAPMCFIGQPGRKLGYIVEDTVWQNVYSTNETDVEKLEAMYLTKSDTFLQHQQVDDMIKYCQSEDDRLDFKRVIDELGFTEQEVYEVTIDDTDKIDLPDGAYKFTIKPSSIAGNGVFASSDIKAGEVIGLARIGNNRTVLGRYCNHSAAPNARIIKHGNDYALIATADIKGQCGGQSGNEITVDYKQVYEVNKG